MKRNKLCFALNALANQITWSAEGLPLTGSEKGDFWRLHLDDDYIREILVPSSIQSGTVTELSDGSDIFYDSVIDTSGKRYEVKLTIHIRYRTEELEMWADIENQEEVRVNELQLPFLDLSTVCDTNREKDVLYRSLGLGERLENPWLRLGKYHTEYMAADYREIWSPLLYPRPSNMAWFGVESAGHFLYMGRHDPEMRTCNFNTGINPRNTAPRLLLAICHYPLAAKGETISCASGIISLQEGDWRNGSDIYGTWARASWFLPAKKPNWVQSFTGWQRVILRHQYGEVFWKYEDLPQLYKEGQKYGLNMLMVFGWWKGRFDNGYPLYEPDPLLGGKDALKRAIKDIQGMGGRVALYTNGVLMDLKSDYYKETGHKISRKDIDGNEYLDHYRFANQGTILRSFGYKTFAEACQATEEWRDKLLENGRVKLSFDPDSIFYDQIGGHHCWLCFDKTHKHGSRGDLDPKYRAENFKAMRGLLTGDQALGSENTVDLFAPYLDYHHGCDPGNWYAENVFPQMFLRTFPETIMTNRFIHDERPDYQLQLNFAFVMGYRFDVSIFRGRVMGIDGMNAYAAHIKKLIELKDRYATFFYQGRFVVNTSFSLPEHIIMTEYEYMEEVLLVFMNKSHIPCCFEVEGQSITVEGDDVYCAVSFK